MILQEANSAGARYLFQQDKYYDVSWDTGDKSIQCGRKVRNNLLQQDSIFSLLYSRLPMIQWFVF